MSELSVGSLSGLAANSYVIDVASGSTLDLSAGAVFPAGSIVQVVSTTKTDTFSTTSLTFTDVPGLSATITPKSSSSKVLVVCNIAYGHSDASQALRLNLVRGSTNIAQPTGGTSQATINPYQESSTNRDVAGVNFLDFPATTSSTTYKIQILTTANTAYVNRGSGDQRAVSGITLMEVAG